jgi:hypothetical protein
MASTPTLDRFYSARKRGGALVAAALAEQPPVKPAGAAKPPSPHSALAMDVELGGSSEVRRSRSIAAGGGALRAAQNGAAHRVVCAQPLPL